MHVLINIDVDDLARGVAFYTQAFGWQEARHLGDSVIELLGAVYENTVVMSLLNGERRPTGLADQLTTLLEALVVRDCE